MKNEKKRAREKLKPWLLSHLRTTGQSQREVGVNVGLSVWESYRNGRTQAPLSAIRKVWSKGVSKAIRLYELQSQQSILAP